MKGDAKLCQVRPLRERLEVVDRLAGFHFDDTLQPAAPFERKECKIGKNRRRRNADRRVLLGSRVDARVELSLEFGL